MPCNGQVSIHQADIITLAHTHTAYLYSAHSGSDFCRLDVFRSLSHGFAIRLEVGLEVKSEQRGNALGHSFGWNNVDGLTGQAHYLARAQHHVAVVWQQNHLLWTHRLDRLEQFLDAGVHRLPSRDNSGKPDTAEDLLKSRACYHGHSGDLLCRLLRLFSSMLGFALSRVGENLLL